MKSKKVAQVYEDYLKSFTNGFLPLFTDNDEYSENEMEDLFKDYIDLSFPPQKVLSIYREIFKEELDEQAFIKESRDCSKHTVKALNNEAFYLICRKLMNLHENREVKIHKNILEILKYFMDY